ncbi:MAG TPA: M55 family metallopeptidase [Candidatus Acidoferrales bacterium]|nr:M55 family metallopeptidase [Candidatus Acidoferrales bacterium]
MRHSPVLLCAVLWAVASVPMAAQSSAANGKKLKVYISVDMEGIAGVVTADQLGPSGFEYERFRRFMTNEAVAAVQAAKAAGATEVVVSDSHGNGESLLIELFPKDVRIVRSWPRRGEMMAGLDSGFDAAMFVGYHASTTNPRGVRAHTFSSARFARVALNGNAVTEGEFNAAYAGALGVPVIFASGDDAAMAELRSRLGNLETVETKKTLGFHSAETLTPEASCEKIATGVRAALDRLHDFKPYTIKTPVTLEITFKNYMPAEVLSYLRAVQRVDSHTIRFVGKDMEEVGDFVEFVDEYNGDLTP